MTQQQRAVAIALSSALAIPLGVWAAGYFVTLLLLWLQGAPQ